MGGPAFGLLCLLLLAAVVVVPLFTADLAKAALAAYRQQQQQQGSGYGAPGAFEARRVTIKELSLRASPPDIVDGGGATAAGGCVLVADLLQSSEIGWAIALHSPDDAPPPQEGHHSNSSCPSFYYTSRRCAGTPMGALMDAAMRTLTLATRGGDRSWAPPPPPPPGWRSETSAAQGWTRLSSGGGDGTDPVGGHVELLLTHPAPHRPIRARLQDGTHVRELFFIPDLVGDLSAPDQERLAAAVAGAAWQTDADGTEAAVQGATDLCQWAHCRVHLDDDHDYDDNEGGLTSQPESGVQRAVPRSKRQTEVIVINRRKKHHGGHGAAVAIGLGVGLGVGIPVVVLLALIPFVIALWLIRKRRRGSRTIRVADVPTGVFAAGQPAENPAYREEEPEYQGSVSPIGSDLQSALGENY